MIEEHLLVPFSVSSLPKGPYLVFSPHPDDEVFGMGGALALAAQRGITVQVVTLTDGALGGDPVLRRAESENAARALGILPPLFWDLPDRSLTDSGIPADQVRGIVSDFSPGCIFLPSFQEVHPDHRAAAWAISSIVWDLPGEFDIWLYEINRQGEINRLLDTSLVMDVKTRAMREHASQLPLFDYEDVTVALDRARAITLGKSVRFAEGFFCLDRGQTTHAADAYLKALELTLPLENRDEERKKNQALRTSLMEARHQIHVLASRLSAVENSMSWRLTAPLRGIKALIRKE